MLFYYFSMVHVVFDNYSFPLFSTSLQATNNDISEHESDHDGVVHAGKELMTYGSGDDVTKLESDVDAVTTRYYKIREAGIDRLRRMTEVPVVLERFYDNHQKVLEWTGRIEKDLQQGDLSPSAPEMDQYLVVRSHSRNRLVLYVLLLCLEMYLSF